MCVVALAWAASPRWHLVVAGNRDEFHARAASPLGRWEDAPGIIAGRDLVSGGGWIGVSDAGRFAVVTNVAGFPRGGDAPSRGALVADFLRDGRVPTPQAMPAFGGFSLMSIGERAEFRSNQPEPVLHRLSPGVHGISNGPLDPPWPRTRTLTGALSGWIDGAEPVDALLALLADETPAVPGERPVFIRDPVYGTRCSTVVTVAADGAGVIIERRFDSSGDTEGETRIEFTWEPAPRTP